LSNVKGHTEVTYYGPHPDGDDNPLDGGASNYLVLKFHREGKDWILSWGTDSDDRSEFVTIGWKPLKDAPLKYKLAAVSMFPDLLEAMEKTQKKLVKEVNNATKFYDEFEARLPKEGK
jgi:hypothetical protein